MKETTCMFCGKVSKFECEKCANAFCCTIHKDFHCPPNRTECYPFHVENNEVKGRYVVASRDIHAGEIVFNDTPIGVGPSHETEPMCLTCFAPADCSFCCPDCGYPMCDDEACMGEHKQRGECEILSNAKVDIPEGVQDRLHYHCILPLRLLLLRESNPELYAMTDQLMDHESDREQSDYWDESQTKVVDRIRHVLGQADRFSADDVNRAIGVLEVNQYEIHNRGTTSFRGTFPMGSLLSHECVPNSTLLLSHTPPYTASVMASVDIPKGKEIFGTYVCHTMNTMQRRKKLKAGWYFECRCDRCADPKELGSKVNAVRCPMCNDGKAMMFPVNPLDFESRWKCDCCSFSVDDELIQGITKNMEDRLQEITLQHRYESSKFLELRQAALEMFHPKHHVLCEITTYLVPVFCRGPGKRLPDFPVEMLELKRQICKDYLEVLDLVCPGLTKKRGKMLYEFTEVDFYLYSQCNSPLNAKLGLEAIKEFQKKLKMTFESCKDIIKCLEYGKSSYFDHVVYDLAKTMSSQCQDILALPDNALIA